MVIMVPEGKREKKRKMAMKYLGLKKAPMTGKRERERRGE